MTDRIPTKTAARIIGVAPQYLCQEMRNGNIDLGCVLKSEKHYNYIIFRAKLEKLIGRELTEEDLEK